MAITGEGTKASPYLVHDYDELKKVCPRDYSGTYNGNELGIKYVRLESNIDCNTYGSSFEWEGFDLGGGSSDGTVVDLNLNGKTIKNVMISTNGCLFIGTNYNGSIYSTIHDGKLLNIFCNNSNSVINSNVRDTSSEGICSCFFENVSMSINADSRTDYLFKRVMARQSSFYIKETTAADNYFWNYGSMFTEEFKNCDFKFEVNDINDKYVFYNQQSNTSLVGLESCRITGKFMKAHFGIYDDRKVINSVLDIESDSYAGNYKRLVPYGSTGIYNSDKLQGDYLDVQGLTAVTTAEMKDASALTAKGFTVVDIGG